MTISQLRLNAEFELYGKPYKVVTIDPPHIWLKRLDGESIQLEYLTLITEPSFKPLKSMDASKKETIEFESKLAKLKGNKRTEVSQRFEIINPIIVLDRIKEGDLQSLYLFKDKFKFLMRNESERLDELKQKDLISKGPIPRSLLRQVT